MRRNLRSIPCCCNKLLPDGKMWSCGQVMLLFVVKNTGSAGMCTLLQRHTIKRHSRCECTHARCMVVIVSACELTCYALAMIWAANTTIMSNTFQLSIPSCPSRRRRCVWSCAGQIARCSSSLRSTRHRSSTGVHLALQRVQSCRYRAHLSGRCNTS